MVSWLDSSSTCLTLKLQSDNKEMKKGSAMKFENYLLKVLDMVAVKVEKLPEDEQ